MIGFLIKIIFCPIVVYLSDLILPQIHYTSIYQPIIVGIIIALVGHGMELLLLKKGTLWSSTTLDFLAAYIIIYISQSFFAGARITFWGAIITALILSFTEYLQHLYFIGSGKTIKHGPDRWCPPKE